MCQRAAATEGADSDAGHSIGECQASESVAIPERMVFDAGHGARDGQACE